MQRRDRYKVLVRIEDRYGGIHDVAELGENDLHSAIQLARRLVGDAGWWEVVDTCTGNLVASSESEQRGKPE